MEGFSENLKKYRKSQGWSKKFIAEKLEVPYQTWCNWESGTIPAGYVCIMIMEKLKEIAKGEISE